MLETLVRWSELENRDIVLVADLLEERRVRDLKSIRKRPTLEQLSVLHEAMIAAGA
jgi:hypothetical protein